VGYDPFTDAGSGMAVLVGMLGVTAMATQNALVKLALRGSPSTAVLTTNITQTIDLVTTTGPHYGPRALILPIVSTVIHQKE
jgi:hypothetical protein